MRPNQVKGKLYGVSVGPGDPEHMTLKAVRIITQCTVIAAPRTRNGASVALDIAARATDISHKKILYLDFLMTRDREAIEARHQQLARLISAELDQGNDVAMLNLGDASIYATYSYMQTLLCQAGYETETVAGVTSFSACAARLGVSLTTAQQPLTIIPGDYSHLETELAREGTKVIMKHGKNLNRVKEALHKTNRYQQAQLVENCGMDNEVIFHNLDEATGQAYFSTIIIGDQTGGEQEES